MDISVRPARFEDEAAVLAVLDDCTRTYAGRPTTPDEVRSRLREGRGPGDAFIAWAGSAEPVGFGHAWSASADELRAFIRCRPDWRSCGVATALLAAIEGVARALVAEADSEVPPRLTVTNWAADEAAAGFLTRSGFSPERHFLQMRRDGTFTSTGSMRAPTGIVIRSFREGADDDAILETFRESFADHWGDANPDPATWWRENRDDPSSGYDPSLWSIAECDGQICGFLIGREREADSGTIGWVSLLGVLPFGRGRGVGEALLRKCIEEFRQRGRNVVALNVDVENVTSALRLYEKVGMERNPSFTIWSKPV